MSKIIIPALLIGALFLMLLALGFWQLERGFQKQENAEDAQALENQPVIDIQNAEMLRGKIHQTVRLRGNYLPERQFAYDNQVRKGRAGYDILVPFALDGGGAVLVHRGFKPWNGGRSVEILTMDENPQTITVRILDAKKRPLLRAQNSDGKFPLIIQSLDFAWLSKWLNHELAPVVAHPPSDIENSIVEKWRRESQKHFGYAVQWFAMAAVLLAIAIRLFVKYRKN